MADKNGKIKWFVQRKKLLRNGTAGWFLSGDVE